MKLDLNAIASMPIERLYALIMYCDYCMEQNPDFWIELKRIATIHMSNRIGAFVLEY